MRLHGEHIGAVESILVRARVVGFDPFDQFKLPDHAAPDRRQPAVGPEIKTILIIRARARGARSEEHTSELQSLMRISYAVFCLKNKKHKQTTSITSHMY